MADENGVKRLAKLLSSARIVLSADVTDDALKSADIDVLASKIMESKKGAAGLSIITLHEINEMMRAQNAAKVPMPVEVIRPAGFKPIAAEIEADYQVGKMEQGRAEGTTDDFVAYFRDRLRKIRVLIESTRKGIYSFSQDIGSLSKYGNGREVCVAGIVSSKVMTKNGNVMVMLEDEFGAEARVIFGSGTSQQSRELFEKANKVINDEVMAIKGKITGPWVIASELIWPDVPIKDKKNIEDDLAIAFVSDIHVGSKRFLQKNFSNMIDWLNGNVENKHKELAGKIKYVVMAGDVADGLGIYPGQDRDLAILDIYAQYQELFSYIDAIPDYIHVFVMPGNHDAVQRAEPQPPLGSDILKDFRKDNVHILCNPNYMNLHGLDVLAYHGTSLDSIISAIPGMSYSRPEDAMIELLKRRHLSPIYGGNVIVPSKSDGLVIDRVPDILHMGHIHKNGLATYHGVEVVNSGTWQDRTDYQIVQGHQPSPCQLPIYEMKGRRFTTVNFKGET